jgi:AcrR family transcriptional regulator
LSRKAISPEPTDTPRDRLVAAAKQLFALRGYTHVSIRDIAAQAGVTSAMIAYHFGNKEQLFHHVYLEASRPINEDRRVRFDELQQSSNPVTVEALLAAWIWPMFSMDDLGSGSPISEMSLSLNAEHAELSDQINTEIYSEVNERLLASLLKVLPNATRRSMAWRLYFLIGSVITITRRHEAGMLRFTLGENRGEDTREMVAELIRYATAGFSADAADLD